jgi:hypothetical protein
MMNVGYINGRGIMWEWLGQMGQENAKWRWYSRWRAGGEYNVILEMRGDIGRACGIAGGV